MLDWGPRDPKQVTRCKSGRVEGARVNERGSRKGRDGEWESEREREGKREREGMRGTARER